MNKSSGKRNRLLLLLLLVLGGIFFLPQVLITLRFKDQIFTNAADIPAKEYAIVFGARVHENDRLSDVARERISAAVLLYRQEKVRKLFISGDNRNNREVDSIAQFAVGEGVPETDLILDYLGIDTNDSCRHFKLVRADAVLVTQSFHLPRALYMCEKIEIKGVGLAANELGLLSSRGGSLPEIYAIRIARFVRESALTWSFILGLYDRMSDEAELLQQKN